MLCIIFNYFRGKGDYYRLGHGTNDHVRKPKPVSGLHGKRVVQFATGLNKFHFVKNSYLKFYLYVQDHFMY